MQSHPLTRCSAGLLLALALALPAAGAVPGEVDFQGLLLDAGGAPVNGSVDLDFEILDAPTGGSPLWSESHTGVQVVDGVYDVTLGSVTPLTPALFADGALYLEITVGGETLSPRERLVAVPYALRAAEAEAVGGISSAFVSALLEQYSFDGADPPNTHPSEGTADIDGDGFANFLDPDNDGDGIFDEVEIATGSDINLPTPTIGGFSPPSADAFVTTVVQVQGTSFQPGLSVVFGSQTPTPVNVTSTSFEVEVGPQSEGNATVGVTNPNGEVGTATFPFFLLTPVISGFEPEALAADLTATVVVSGQNFAPGITVAFGSENPTPTNVTSTSFEVQVGPQPEGSVSVVVTHPNGKVSDPASFEFYASRRIFVSSSLLYDGDDLGGIAGADAICNTLADAGGLPGGFKAWLSDATTSPATSFVQSGVPYLRPDDVVVADDWADLVDGTLDAPIEITQFGNSIAGTGNVNVWTGTLPDGTADPAGQDCGDWGATSGSGMVGSATQTTGAWSDQGTRACNLQARIYCVQQ